MNILVEYDKYFDEFLPIFHKVLHEYEYRLYGYNYKIREISKSQYVFLIENSFAVFVYVKRSPFWDYYCTSKEQAEITGNIRDLFEICFKELLYNEVFFFSAAKIQKELRPVCRTIHYFKFDSTVVLDRDKHENDFLESSFCYVHQKIPEFHLLEIFDNWKGHLYNYVIYEYEMDGKTGYASFYTSSPVASYEAYQKESVLEMGLMSNYAYPNNSSSVIGYYYHEGIVIDKKFLDIGVSLIEKGKASKWASMIKKGDRQSFLSGKLKYFIVPIHLRRIDNDVTANLLKKKVLKNARQGEYTDIERTVFNLSDYKWTSELLCYQLMTEIYKKNMVVHQYRPYFLKSEKGQLSYDVFVFGKNIALEYQGRQHFEPIEIFGGKVAFEKQKERDLLKKRISEQCGIHLIYVNYWENITKDLIKQKIKEVMKS